MEGLASRLIGRTNTPPSHVRGDIERASTYRGMTLAASALPPELSQLVKILAAIIYYCCCAPTTPFLLFDMMSSGERKKFAAARLSL